jgi:medium-chain acyl-[acyl-carrier-protein] hydrolase
VTISTDNRWLPKFKPNPRARIRLFCLPNAGAGSSIYRQWQAALPPEIQVLPVHLPGRETRIGETPHSDSSTLVDALLEGLRVFLDSPFAFFGHSMGGLLSFELARALRRMKQPLPKVLMISATKAPQMQSHRPDLSDLPEPEFRKALVKYNGTPQAVLDHPEMMELFGPILRADFKLVEKYRFQPEAPLEVPMVAFGGVNDSECTQAELEGWKEQAGLSFAVQVFPGDHFYLAPQREPLLRRVATELAPYLR